MPKNSARVWYGSIMPRTRSARFVGLDSQTLEAALAGLEAQRQRIDEQINRVRAIISPRRGRPEAYQRQATPVSASKQPKKRTMSPAARRRIGAAQKKRWAEFRKRQAAKTK
jgi:hypothetical protein